MTIEISKEKLKKEGYTTFNLKEFDSEFYNWLLNYKCNEEKNLKKYFTYLKADTTNGANGWKIKNNFLTYENACVKKNELLKDKDKIIIQQMWFFSDLNPIFGEKGESVKFQNYVKKIVKYFFDFDETQEYSFFAPMFTYYDVGCRLQNHSDGRGTGRICALLIYLNETYDEKDGGCLILNNNEKVIPTFGQIAILDLQTFDIQHMVTEVTGGIGRYAILSFIKKIEDEFINSPADREKVLR